MFESQDARASARADARPCRGSELSRQHQAHLDRQRRLWGPPPAVAGQPIAVPAPPAPRAVAGASAARPRPETRGDAARDTLAAVAAFYGMPVARVFAPSDRRAKTLAARAAAVALASERTGWSFRRLANAWGVSSSMVEYHLHKARFLAGANRAFAADLAKIRAFAGGERRA